MRHLTSAPTPAGFRARPTITQRLKQRLLRLLRLLARDPSPVAWQAQALQHLNDHALRDIGIDPLAVRRASPGALNPWHLSPRTWG